MSELRFEANLPEDAKMPVKPTTGRNDAGLRRVRVWLDAWLSPGETEKLLLLGEETFDVTISRRAVEVLGAPATSDDAKVVMASADGYDDAA